MEDREKERIYKSIVKEREEKKGDGFVLLSEDSAAELTNKFKEMERSRARCAANGCKRGVI